MDIFLELTIILFIATFFAILMRLLKQPLIIGYILAGIIAGPSVFNVLKSTEDIELFSKIGITILLFIVGLSLSPKVIKEVGKVSLVTGIGQVVFTSLFGFIISLLLGLDRVAAIYVAIALTFSSTIIILKLLSDKGDINSLYGKISIGFLLVQDIVATIILILVSSLGASTSGVQTTLVLLVLKGLGLFLLLSIFSSYLMPRISRFVASSSELLFLFSLAWGLGLASVFYALGLSVEIGALVAGVVLSITPFSAEIASRMKPLRDFFIILFFILLGSQIVISDIGSLVLPAIILSLFVLIGNPIIVVILMNLLGYKRKTGFQAGLTVAQISEFSLILATVGFNLGHISSSVLSLITLVGLITIAGSTYLILYSNKIFLHVENIIKILELRKQNTSHREGSENYEAILFGYNRVGKNFVDTYTKLGKRFIVVDHNPEAIAKLDDHGIPNKFGDVTDVEFFNELNLEKVKLVVSTIPDHDANILLTQKIKDVNTETIILVISQQLDKAIDLYDLGASYVIMPHHLGAKYAAQKLSRFGVNKDLFTKERDKHMRQIAKLIASEAEE